MPDFIYRVSPLIAALLLVAFIETVSLLGLFLIRRFVLPRLGYATGVNEAVSGTVQAIGVFYGITVGLIAVGVWTTNSESSNLVSKEASEIATLYRDVGGYPSPVREQLRGKLREYTVYIIQQAWPEQKKGHLVKGGIAIMDDFQTMLYSFHPSNQSELAIHTEALRAYNSVFEYRQLRIDAVNDRLSGIMWAVIWVGAIISIGVACFYQIKDGRIHAILIALMGGFLAMVLFMISVNDRPFYGHVNISPEPYQLVLDRLIDGRK